MTNGMPICSTCREQEDLRGRCGCDAPPPAPAPDLDAMAAEMAEAIDEVGLVALHRDNADVARALRPYLDRAVAAERARAEAAERALADAQAEFAAAETGLELQAQGWHANAVAAERPLAEERQAHEATERAMVSARERLAEERERRERLARVAGAVCERASIGAHAWSDDDHALLDELRELAGQGGGEGNDGPPDHSP